VNSTTARDGTWRVFNIEVENDHVYYVGLGSVLVHNRKCFKGGTHEEMTAVKGDGLDSHHLPAKQANPSVDPKKGTAIQMDPSDHRRTASYGGGPGSAQQAYRDKQKALIDAGRLDDAFLMDVHDIQSKFGNKYDEAILEAIDKLPSGGKK
jgi:hypothetical protein